MVITKWLKRGKKVAKCPTLDFGHLGHLGQEVQIIAKQSGRSHPSPDDKWIFFIRLSIE